MSLAPPLLRLSTARDSSKATRKISLSTLSDQSSRDSSFAPVYCFFVGGVAVLAGFLSMAEVDLLRVSLLPESLTVGVLLLDSVLFLTPS